MEPWVSTLIGALIVLLVNALFIHLSASILVKGKQRYTHAILAAFLGSLAYALIVGFLQGSIFGPILGVLAWLMIVGAIYSTGLIKALLIGLLAGLIQWGVSAVVAAVGKMF